MSYFTEDEGEIEGYKYIIKIPHVLRKGRKAVIGCRGWAYQGEFKENLHRHLDPLGNMIADYGYYWASTDYGAGGYPLRKALRSVNLLIRILKEKYGIEKVALIGVSMGANIALLYAIEHPNEVNCVIDIYGVVDPREQAKYIVKRLAAIPLYAAVIESSVVNAALKFLKDLRAELGGNPTLLKFNKNYDRYSPLRRANELKTPILIVHGECDDVVPIRMSRMFASKLIKLGKKELIKGLLRVKCGGHDERTVKIAINRILTFLDECLS